MFANAPFVGVSACVGGEKVAAVGGKHTSVKHDIEAAHEHSSGLDVLVDAIKSSIQLPKRRNDGNFLFSGF